MYHYYIDLSNSNGKNIFKPFKITILHYLKRKWIWNKENNKKEDKMNIWRQATFSAHQWRILYSGQSHMQQNIERKTNNEDKSLLC